MFSEKYKPDYWIFHVPRPESPIQIILFALATGYFTGISGTAAHELVHEKSAIHKFWGNWTYIIGMYTHFWDEHVQGHHKFLATDKDPVCHKVGANIYTGTLKAIWGTHVTNWVRENERL